MSKHTPGPWTVVQVQRKSGLIGFEVRETSHEQGVICEIDAKPYLVHVKEENAALIAAAPETAEERDRLKEINAELLEACKEAFKLIELARQHFPKSMHNSDKFKLENTCAVIGNAIAKADGRS